MNIPEELVEAFANRKAALFIGAGMSTGAGLPDWEMLMRRLAEQFDDCPSSVPFPDIAQYYENAFSPNYLIRKLKELLNTSGVEPTLAHQALVSFPVEHIFTTNLDDLLEKALRAAGVEFDLVVNEAQSHLSSDEGKVCLVKLHGNLTPPEGIVITSDQYERYLSTHPSLVRKLSSAIQDRTVLFLGYSVTDPDFRQLLTQLRVEAGGFPRNVFSVQFNTNSLTQNELKRRHIQVINLDVPLRASESLELQRHLFNQTLAAWLRALWLRVQQKIDSHQHTSVAMTDILPVAHLATEISFWLEARGYSIEERRPIGRNLEDRLVRLPEGVRILVRCVDGEIEMGHVMDLERDRIKKKLPTAWLVCYKRVAQSAITEAQRNGHISLFNLARFMRTIFGPYFDHLHDLVNSTEIGRHYVDLSCYKPVLDNQGRLQSPPTYDHYPVIDQYVDDWLKEPGKNHLSVLGEFGQGKTWFCRHYAYIKLQRYLENPITERIPLLINLREYRSGNIRQLITDLLVNRYQIKLPDPYQLFEKLNRRGRLLLLFDGFDEMTSEVDDKTTKANFDALAATAVPNSKVLLTCRTPYFRSVFEERSVLGAEVDIDLVAQHPNFEIIYLQEFDEEKVKEVLRKRVPGEWESYMQRIAEVYDLPNLAQRPVMLDMIVATLPDLEGYDAINHAMLYQTYTNKWINKEIEEERALLDAASKRFFAQEVAWDMFKSGHLTITARKMTGLVGRYLESKLTKPENVIFLEHDIRTSSFLSKRDESGNYEFMHRSFMEFFVAQKLAQSIEENDKAPLEERAIYYEIIRFLNQILSRERDIPRMLAWSDDPRSGETLRANCIRLSGQWLEEDVLKKLIELASASAELSSLRRDAIRSILRILHGEEADWVDRHVRFTLNAFAIRTSRNTLNVECLPIHVKVLREVNVEDARSRLRQAYSSQVIELFLKCLKNHEPAEVRINVSYALIHFASANVAKVLTEHIQNELNQYVRFNCSAALIAMNSPDRESLERVIGEFSDPQMLALGRMNLALIEKV